MFPNPRTALLPALLLALPLATSALERTELIPAEAQTYIRVSSTTNFWTKFKLSSVGRLWSDQQFQDFLGNPDAEMWQEFFFQGESDAEDQVFMEQLKMLNGELILAFEPGAQNPCIIAAMSEADFNRSLELDENLLQVVEEPFEILKSDFQDVEIIQHLEHGGTDREISSWQAHLENTIVLGHSREWVERCIVQLRKDGVEEPQGPPRLDINIPVSRLVEQSLKESKTGTSERALLEALGIMAIENFTAAIELKADEMVVDNTLRITDLGRGLFAILDVQPSELPTVTFIPENIASIEVGRVNLLGLWQEIPAVLGAAQPQAKLQFDMLLNMIQQQAGINLEQDLLSNLGTRYVSFATVDNGIQTSVMAIDLKDGRAFKKGLETAIAAPAMQPYVANGLDIADFLDHTIYTLKTGNPEIGFGIAVVGNRLLYGQPAGLRQVIRAESSDAASNQAFECSELVKGLRRHVPARAFTYNAIDWKKNTDAIVKEISKPEYTTLIQQKWAKSGSALPPPDFSKLPPTDHIASFFNVSYQYVEATPEGLHQQIILKY